jgi:hypothetical protein
MFGKFLSTAIRVVTLPVDAVNVGMDIATGGDGSKESREDVPLTSDLEKLRDAIADTAEDLDD